LGGEFRPFTRYLTFVGIHHRLICPYTHHQNGVIERKHRHIVGMGLTLLSHAFLPITFWDHGFHTVVYIINRLPCSVAPHFVPHSTLFHHNINYKFFKTFGCACYPYTRPYDTNKLQFRSTTCTFLGYSSCHKGYKCLNSHGKIFISKYDVFYENTFPFSTSVQSHVITTSSSCIVPLDIIPFIVDSPSQHATHESLVDILPNDLAPPDNYTSQLYVDTFPDDPTPADNSPSQLHSPQHAPSLVSVPPAHDDSSSSHSTHPMQTRSKSRIVKPRRFPTILFTVVEPQTVKQALISPYWCQAMQAEYDALMTNHTWSLTTLPPRCSTIGCKWVFRVKENSDGTINKYKAHIVAKGYHKKFGCDYSETFSPIVKPVNIRLVLTLALTNN